MVLTELENTYRERLRHQSKQQPVCMTVLQIDEETEESEGNPAGFVPLLRFEMRRILGGALGISPDEIKGRSM
eukprot:38867-Eustigmatos_ZCMA.PRE.1